MAQFSVNQPVTTEAPTVLVDAGLPIGRQRFQLFVVDSAGNRSRADEVIVVVARAGITTGPVIASSTPLGPLLTPRPRGRRSEPR